MMIVILRLVLALSHNVCTYTFAGSGSPELGKTWVAQGNNLAAKVDPATQPPSMMYMIHM